MNVAIVGANGGIGREITKNFLKKDRSQLDKLSLVSDTKQSCNFLTSFAQDVLTQLPLGCISVGKEPKLLNGANVVIFCAGEAVSSKKMRREDLLKSNKLLFERYLNKMSVYAPNAVVFLVTNPVSQILQQVKCPSNLSLVGIGVANDTYRLQQNFNKKFGYNEKNLFMVGDHLAHQEMTLSQVKPSYAKQIVDEEERFFEKNKITDIYEFIREKNYALLRGNDAKKMFAFVESLPLKYQGVARQRFVHFLTKTGLSTSITIDRLFEALSSGERVCCEAVLDSYLGLDKSVLGVPIVFEGSKIVPVELNYSGKEIQILEQCSKLYPVK